MSESVVPGLKNAMKQAGYTQKALAEEMGLAVSTVARWSNGEQEPSISTVKKLSEILHCSVAELLGISSETVEVEKAGCSILRVERNHGKKLITLEITD